MSDQIDLHTFPKNWIWVTMGDISIISSGGTPDRKNSAFYRGETLWVKSGELNYNIIIQTEEKINELALENSSAKIFPKETILVALYGATVGKLAILGKEAATNQAVAGVITTESTNNKYIYYYLVKNRDKLLQQRQGGAQPNISQKILSEFSVPLPPIEDQHLIVEKIEELFSELDQAEKSFTKIFIQLKTYKQAVLRSAFEGKLTEYWRKVNETVSASEYLKEVTLIRKNAFYSLLEQGKKVFANKINYNFTYQDSLTIPGWATAKLDKLVTIAGRVGWKGLKKEEYTKSGPLFISVHSLNYGKYVEFKDAFHISEERYNESSEIKLVVDDILLCKDGAGIGKIGIVKNLPDRATINSSLLIIRGNEIFIPDFLYYLFKGPHLQQIVNERISGSAIPHLFQKDIKEFILQIPPIDEQKQIVQEIEYRFTIADNLEDTIKQSQNKIDALRHRILKNAFEGKLVETVSRDVDVNLLLDKIKQEKNSYLNFQKEIRNNKPIVKRKMNEKKSILDILKASEMPIPAEEVWQQSVHKDNIEGFYAALKLIQNDVNSVKKEAQSFLSLKNENR